MDRPGNEPVVPGSSKDSIRRWRRRRPSKSTRKPSRRRPLSEKSEAEREILGRGIMVIILRRQFDGYYLFAIRRFPVLARTVES